MIEVEGLTKRYGTTTALQDVTFSVRSGEVVGLLGPNGAGKSTTMRILAGSLGATAGHARIDGHDVLEEPQATRARLGYLPEVPPLYVEMTVRDYVRFCARIKRMADPGPAVERVLQRVGLHEVAHRLIGHLSKGFRQRVGLAQALVHGPRVLVLDEPSSGLDPEQRVEIRELVRELSEGDVTVILSTHVLAEIQELCDRVLILRQGRLVAEDSIDALAGTAITLRVARPDDALLRALETVPGVDRVEASGDRVRVFSDGDLREAVAEVAVRWGLLELTLARDLEAAYLALTRSV